MADDVPDYMSDDLLNSGDVRPGLLFSRQQKRQAVVDRRRREANDLHRQGQRPRKLLQSERLEQGLAQPIDENNKGFALLQKMGYKPGSALGKQKGGIVEPIAVTVKSDRAGLGRQAVLDDLQHRKRVMFAARQRLRAENAAASAEEFRQRMRDKMADRHVSTDLARSQRVCQQLDEGINVETPAEPWFWPLPLDTSEEVTTTPDDSSIATETTCAEIGQRNGNNTSAFSQSEQQNAEESSAFSPNEQLDLLTHYLRSTHCYCIWCGCSFDGADDLKDQCPGNTRQDHD